VTNFLIGFIAVNNKINRALTRY